jgi:hypothetical protein
MSAVLIPVSAASGRYRSRHRIAANRSKVYSLSYLIYCSDSIFVCHKSPLPAVIAGLTGISGFLRFSGLSDYPVFQVFPV